MSKSDFSIFARRIYQKEGSGKSPKAFFAIRFDGFYDD